MTADKVLVTYGTWDGSTAEVAASIGKTLAAAGVPVEVMLAEQVRDLSPYSAVVLGSPVHMGFLRGSALRFASRFREQLAGKLVAYFVVCLTMKDDTPEARAKAGAYAAKLARRAPGAQPVEIGLFPGRHKNIGDFTRPEAVQAWAEGLARRLHELPA